MAARIKKGDLVCVIAGKDGPTKGEYTTGKVLKVIAENNRAIVEGVNMVTKHQRPTQQNQEGGIIQKEAPIHMSNLMHYDTKANMPTRVRMETKGDKKVRVSVRTGTVLEGQ